MSVGYRLIALVKELDTRLDQLDQAGLALVTVMPGAGDDLVKLPFPQGEAADQPLYLLGGFGQRARYVG